MLDVECSVLDVSLPTEHRTFNLQRSTSNGNGAPGGRAFPEAGSWKGGVDGTVTTKVIATVSEAHKRRNPAAALADGSPFRSGFEIRA